MKKEGDRVNLEHKISTRKGKATSLPKKLLNESTRDIQHTKTC